MAAVTLCPQIPGMRGEPRLSLGLGKRARLLGFPGSCKCGSALGCSSGHGCVLLGVEYKGPVLVFSTVVSPMVLRAPLIDADFVAPVNHG